VRRVVKDLTAALGGVIHVPGKGLQGWPVSVQAYDAGGHLLGRVYYGGDREDVHVVSTSDSAELARPLVVKLHGARTARVDTRVDTLLPFPRIHELMSEAAARYGSRITTMQSFERGESLGRTTYLGSPSSMVRVRVYEKWLESPGEYVEGTNRVEVQLRPQSRMKLKASELTRAESFCATRTTRDLAELLGSEVADAGSLRVKRGRPELEAMLAAMGKQYSKGVERWLRASGGDLERVIEHLVVG
jgi:hypothetical protein